MALADSDSDYGWDLSPEEERLLATQLPSDFSNAVASQLSGVSHPPSSQTSVNLVPTFAAGADVVTDEPVASLYEKKDHRDVSDADRTSFYRHEASRVSREAPASGPPGVRDVGTSLSPVYLEREIPRSIPSPDDGENISYPDLSSVLSNIGTEPEAEPTKPFEPEAKPASATKPPLARFRTYPKKPFSVSDLTAGAWCEVQYEHTLTRLPGGRRTRTPAMRAGTKVHKKLEDQVRKPMRVEVTTKEDAFGLKLWNIVQGLRTLRETGITRELEVWGIVDGQVVNGIIDSLSYASPDPEFEEEILSSQESKKASSEAAEQQKITGFFPSQKPAPLKNTSPEVYLTDVKTRGTRTLPSMAAMRPAKIQLFLYHRFLSEMARGKLDFLFVIRRYGLDPDRPFSDLFMAEIGSFHDEIFDDALSTPPTAQSATSVQPTPDLLRYSTISSLLPLITHELNLAFPQGAESLGSILTVEYRLRPRYSTKDEDDQEAGRIIHSNTFPMSDGALEDYLSDYMEWWRGERTARGVDLEDAGHKCGCCEFADICEWRRGLDEERLRQAKERLASQV